MNWHFAPELPTEPGLYVVLDDSANARPQLLRWSAHAPGWRLGARTERVDAFLGPLPVCAFPHAEVEHLFAPPARDVPLQPHRAPNYRNNRR